MGNAAVAGMLTISLLGAVFSVEATLEGEVGLGHRSVRGPAVVLVGDMMSGFD